MSKLLSKCLVCGEPFTAVTSWQKYCGELCQSKARKESRRQRRLRQHLEKCIDV